MYLGKANQLHTALSVPSSNGTTAVWSYSFQVGFGISFALQYQFASNVGVGVRIQLEQSYKKLDGSSTNLTELLTSTLWVVPDLQPDVVTLASDQLSHIIGFAPSEARWARFKLIGQAQNDSSTTVSLVVLSQEPGRGVGAA